MHKKNPSKKGFKVFVAPPGLEPGISEPKSGVLPLHHGAKACAKIGKRK